ncbi:MAG: thiamine phosphate synthase [Candidatus Methanoplasma sp.]|jgi:thiamine-phosphate pyrophosphorylase|nr:thiamine phosphate synthase [Candidatus Methanoplasma sp.]
MIIAITDRKISSRSDFLEQIEAIADSSPDMIILREKDLSEAQYRYLAVECMRICSYRNVEFCVNSFIKTAATIGSGRIQISLDSFIGNREALADFEEIWVSVHSVGDAAEAERLGATHLIYGNVYETSCKPGAEGRGTEELRKVCETVGIPVFAVGGINADNVTDAMDAGCRGVCVRSLLMGAKDPSAVMSDMRMAENDIEK